MTKESVRTELLGLQGWGVSSGGVEGAAPPTARVGDVRGGEGGLRGCS